LKFVPTVVVSAALLVFLQPILELFGPHYADGAAACAWFLTMPISRALFGNATLVLQIRGHRADILWSTIAALGLMALGAYAGGTLNGATGAAAGCSLAYCVLMATRYLSCRMRTGIDTSIFSSPSALLGSARSDG
jgi:O-antigen/teichoic acid export membrane protein